MSDIAIKPDGRNLTFAGMLFHTRVAFISVGSNKEQGSPGCEKEADRMRAAEHGMAKASKTRLWGTGWLYGREEPVVEEVG